MLYLVDLHAEAAQRDGHRVPARGGLLEDLVQPGLVGKAIGFDRSWGHVCEQSGDHDGAPGVGGHQVEMAEQVASLAVRPEDGAQGARLDQRPRSAAVERQDIERPPGLRHCQPPPSGMRRPPV